MIVSTPPNSAEPTPTPRRSFFRRRIGDPILALLTHGVTPDKIAGTLAVGTACSMFPFLGFTALLNLGVGLWFRMNQPILQTLNQLLGPVHLVMIVLYVRWGEWIWGATDDRFTLSAMLTSFREEPLAEFLQHFGRAGLHAFTAWAISVPIIIGVLYYTLRPIMRRAARLNVRPSRAA